MSDLFRSSTWALFLWIGFATGEASGLVIYRFGGEALAPPPEASGEGVDFYPAKLDRYRGRPRWESH